MTAINMKDAKSITFGAIKDGDMFVYNDLLYQKSKQLSDNRNAYCITSYRLANFGYDTAITPVKSIDVNI